MEYPTSYEGLYTADISHTHPARLLKPGSDPLAELQFREEGRIEHFAVRGDKPYGIRTDEAFLDESSELMKGEYRGEDYTVFSVPSSLLALRAISLGADIHKLEKEVLPLYSRIGLMVVEQASLFVIPMLTIDNIAVDRNNGNVVFVPPVDFAEGSTSATELLEGLAVSISQSFDARISQERAIEFGQALKAEVS
jgi:hypothetical protein